MKKFNKDAFINILTGFTAPLASLADLAFLGQQIDIKAPAAVAMGSIVFDYLFWSLGFLRMGTTSIASRELGAGSYKEQIKSTSSTLINSLVLGLALGALILAFKSVFLSLSYTLLNITPELIPDVDSYYNARIMAAPLALAIFTLQGWFIGIQKPHLSLIVVIFMNLANIILNYFFVIVWGQGALGAGQATAIAQTGSFVLALGIGLYFLGGVSLRTFKEISKDKILDIIRFNAHLFFRTLALITSFSLFHKYSGALGNLTLVANSILFRFFVMCAHIIDGFAISLESHAGNHFGLKNYKVVQALLNFALKQTIIICVLICLTVYFLKENIFALLNKNASVVSLLNEYTWGLILVVLSGAAAFIYDGFFIGIGKVKELRNSMLVSLFVGFLPLAMYSVYLQSNATLWIALTVFMLFRSLSLLRIKNSLTEFKS